MTGALIIATGNTPGSNGFDPLKMTGRISAMERLIIIFKQAGLERIAVVCENDMKIEKRASRLGVVCLHNTKGNPEMLDSVKTGLDYLEGRCKKALITPVDVPLFSVETVRRLTEQEAAVAIPCFEGKGGHPLLLAEALFDGVVEYEGEGGLAAAVEDCCPAIQYVPVDDEGVLVDIEKEKEYESFVENHSLRELRPETRFFLAREDVCFGPDMYNLLLAIDETNSVHGGCGQAGVSYSKGWKMIAEMEGQLGYQVVERMHGGKDGGKSFVSEKGRELMKKYCAYLAECERSVQEIFSRHFPNG